MNRKKIFIISCLLVSTLTLAGENDDIKFLDQVYKQQNYDLAINESKRFLVRYPKSKNLRKVEERMAKTFYFRKKYSSAIEHFTSVLGKYPLTTDERNEILYYIAKSYLLIEDEAMADQYIAQMDRSNIYYERAFYDKGVIYLDRDEYEKAFKTFQSLAQSGKELQNSAVFNMALTAYNDGQYPLVIDILNRYVPLKDKNRDESAINYLYGTSYYKLDLITNAIKHFELLSDKYPNTPYGKKARVTLIEIYANRNDLAQVNKYSALVKGTPEEQEAFSVLGDFYVANGQYDKAKEYYKLANIDSNPRALYGYAYALFRQDKIKEALPYFTRLEKTSYYNQAIYYKFACYYKLKDYKKILAERETAKKIVVTQQDNDNINIIIANSAYELENYPLARDYYTKLNMHTPSKDNLFRVITMSGKLNRANDVEGRIADYHRLYPGDREYKKRIYIAGAESLYNNGKALEAEKLYRNYLSEENDPDILNALTSLLINEKKYRDAEVFLEKQTPSTENDYLRAVAFTGLGDYSNAQTLYSKVLGGIDREKEGNLYIRTKLNQIKNYFLAGDYNSAISEGELYLQMNDALEREDIIEKIGISYFRINEFQKSREYFSKLMDNPAKFEEANFQIGDSYMSEKSYEKARSIYQNIYNTSTNEKNREIALYSLGKVALSMNSPAEYKKISAEFLKNYPDSEFKENFISNFSKVAENIKNDADIAKTYSVIYQNSTEEHVKQNALEKMVESYIQTKNYREAEKLAPSIKDGIKKAYFLSQVYEKTNRMDSAAGQYVKLVKSPDFKEYSAANLAKYHFGKKNYTKAREYYIIVAGIRNSNYRDLALFQIATIDEEGKKTDSALKYYKQLYTEYKKSPFTEDAKLKAAQLQEGKNINESVKLYVDLAKNSKNSRYKVFALEKLIFLNLKSKQIQTAKQYHTQLKKIDAATAAKYDDYLKEGN
ncbi:MAG: tetratricopeptide repeat protein [Fusobacteriaceae bacterium]